MRLFAISLNRFETAFLVLPFVAKALGVFVGDDEASGRSEEGVERVGGGEQYAKHRALLGRRNCSAAHLHCWRPNTTALDTPAFALPVSRPPSVGEANMTELFFFFYFF